jgi:DNA-binding transcriptional LysR family regulator
VAKSVVSKHLSQLESRLGVRLLERSSRRVALTREGEALLPRVESLLAEARQLQDLAGESLDRPRGLVRIAATPEFGGYMAERFFPAAVARYPEIRLAMIPAYAFEDLQDPAFDLAFRIGEVKDDRLVARPLGIFHRILVASPRFLREHAIRKPADLAHTPCLTFSGSSPSAQWSLVSTTDGRRGATIEVAGPVSVRSFATLLGLARTGLGVAFVPEFIAREALRSKQVARCLPGFHSPGTTVYLAHRPGSTKISRVRAVRDLALGAVPNLLSPLREG